MQVFADDISMAIKGKEMSKVVEMADKLAGILKEVLRQLGLTLSIEKCRNFLIQVGENAIRLFKRGNPTSRWFKTKEKVRKTAMQAEEAAQMGSMKTGENSKLPYQDSGNFKLLGLTLDSQWAFHGHHTGLLKKLRVRSAVLRKVSNTKWGLENRILTITVHALIESVIGYGLSLTGSSISVEDMEKMDTVVLNPMARRVTGLGYSARREVLFSLADMRTTQNHYLQKVANVLDRVLRAGGTQAQTNLLQYLSTQGMEEEQLWISTENFCDIQEEEKRPSDGKEPRKQMTTRREHEEQQPMRTETRWWIPKERKPIKAARQTQDESIYIPQATELKQSVQAKKMVFQYEGLKDWRQVAIKVLRNVGWTLGCVYNDTLYPNKGGKTHILWDKIDPGAIKTHLKPPTKDGIDIHIWDWQHEDMAIIQLIVCLQGKVQHSNNYVLGRLHEGTSRTHKALALTVGLERAYNCLVRSDEVDGELFEDQGCVTIYTDYEPFQDQSQLDRWRLYGSPNPPAPNQNNLNAILAKWTRLNNVKKLDINETLATDLHRDQMESWCRRKLTDLCKMERVKKWEVPISMMHHDDDPNGSKGTDQRKAG